MSNRRRKESKTTEIVCLCGSQPILMTAFHVASRKIRATPPMPLALEVVQLLSFGFMGV
jgi:hypothetical protein